MRMKNPFARDSGDENGDDAGAQPGDDPIAPPAEETQQSEQPAAETAQSESPAAETEMSEQPSSEAETSEQQPSGDQDDADGQQITAPSIGPNTVIEHTPPEERLDHDKISDVDAMGKDKRREVVGGTYGPTRARVFGTFAAFFAIVAALAVGFYFLAKELDQPPESNPDAAPWAEPDAEQKPPRPIQ
jgi:hypothetical protein